MVPGVADLTRILAPPARSGLFVDFDGTLAPIVQEPELARPLPGSKQALAALARRLAVVAVVSGRSVAFLERHLPAGVVLSGLYGLESRLADGTASRVPPGPWPAVIADATAQARAELPAAVRVESKGTSVTLHFRSAPEAQEAVERFSARVAAATGLVARPAKRSVELHPPLGTDKGTVLDDLTAGLDGACYVGDDVGDLAAFDALDRFVASGGRACRVAVRGAERDEGLVARADVVLEGPEQVRDLLGALASGWS